MHSFEIFADPNLCNYEFLTWVVIDSQMSDEGMIAFF